MKLKLATITLMIIFLAGCEKIKDYDQEVLFQVEYYNFAWGTQHSGYLVDSSGSVIRFNLPEHWNLPDENGYISASEMHENLSQLEEISCRIEAGTLKENYNRLLKAQKGEITDPEQRMFDAGSTTYSGFIFEPAGKRYRQVILRQEGDMYIENKSGDALQLYLWMKNICKSK